MKTYDEYIKRERLGYIGLINKILLCISAYGGVILLGLLYYDLTTLQDTITEYLNTTQLLEVLQDTNKLEQCVLKIASFC